MKDELTKIKHAINDFKELNSNLAKSILENASYLNRESVKNLAEIIHTDQLPKQTFRGQQFSQFPLTVLQEKNFCLDIYHWYKAHTSIHDHNFEGAFKVIKGKYRQKLYTFRSEEKVFPWLETGEMKLISDDILSEGAVIEIASGDVFIHSTEHPDGECITACLRNSEPKGYLHSYVFPGLKITHIPESEKDIKIMDYISYLAQTGSNNANEIDHCMIILNESILLRIIFSINVHPSFNSAAYKTHALQILKSRYKDQGWIKKLQETVISEKLNFKN